MGSHAAFTQKVLIASVIFLITAGFIFLLANFFQFFLLVFAGLLLAVLLSAIANFLSRVLKLNRGVGLAIAVILFLGILIGSWVLMAPKISSQVTELKEVLPKSLEKIKATVTETTLGQKAVNQLQENGSSYMPSTKTMLHQATSFFTGTLNVIADVFIIIITGIFFAASPLIYQMNVVNLVPPRLRTRFLEVLDTCYNTLKLWLMAKFLSMVIVGVLTGIGLSILGLPLALVLGLIAFFITFIPTIGPYLSALPAVLIAFLQGMDMVLYVILLYFAIQMVETYLITPIIYKKTVHIPPAITLFSLVFLGTFSGILGILLSGPIVAALRVFIKELYIKDYLENEGNSASTEEVERKDNGLEQAPG